MNKNSRLHHHVEANTAKIADNAITVTLVAPENKGKIGITVGRVIATGAAAIKKRINDGILTIKPS